MSALEEQPVPVQDQPQTEVPPVGEEIHLPGPSVLPLTTAVGITLTIIGLTIGLVWIVIGFVTFVVSVGLWIRSTRHEMDELPDEHHAAS